MAGIPPVTMSDGRVLEINEANSREIYTEMRKGNIELTSAQQAELNTFLTDEIRESVNYIVAEKDGQDMIDTTGTEGGDSSKGAAATATAASGVAVAAVVGTILAICKGIPLLASKSATNGFLALASGIAALVAGGLAFAMSFRDIFDPDAATREALKSANDGNLQLVQAQEQGLKDGMNMMQEDQENYADNAALMTEEMNINAGIAADLMAQIMVAEAYGDTKTVEELKKQLEEVQGVDYEHYQEVLDEIVAGQGDYSVYTGQSRGLSQSGTTVAEFLQFGHVFKKFALANEIALFVAGGVLAAITAIAAIPKIWAAFFPVDAAPGIAGSIMLGAAALLMLGAGKKMNDNRKFETECGEAGDKLAENIAALNSEITGSEQTMEDTQTSLGETDENEQGKREEGEETANKALANANVPEGAPPEDNPPPTE